jgi:glycosyltransferase involved in cell wall biosynthesis
MLDHASHGDAEPAQASAGRMRVYYDASHIIRFGFETAVGVARVDNYVAEFLARDPGLDVRFVVFDAALCGFRRLDEDEAVLLARILFRRYEQSVAAPPVEWGLAAEPAATMALAQVPRPEPEPLSWRLLLRHMRTASTLSLAEFDLRLTRYAGRVLPVTREQGVARRLARRVVRRIGLIGARRGHVVVSHLHAALTAARYAVRPDPAQNVEAAPSAIPTTAEPPAPSPCVIRFGNGSVVLSMANAWDYMDYAYLHRICRDNGVRFVSVVYDVIAMQFPFTTPNPQHIYHRHWVEIGHSAAHLLAISRFSVDQYREFIAEPNDLSPALSYAYLPNFLRDRADEIGETPVTGLLRRNFVMFCSTIETRKNHLLLLLLWDRLRLEFADDVLPMLVFVGKWGWGTETVRIMSERNFHLRGRLTILDRVSDAELIWIYRHARFTVFPAISEGYGLGAAESLSFGTPVVISDCPALVEATEGLMPAHDPLDFMAWLDEMRGLIRDDARLNELRAAAARYRGPAYDAFAGAVRDIAVAVSEPAMPAVERG